MKLIVGLGNPGEKYADNRHNLGFKVVDAFIVREGGWFRDNKALQVWEAKTKSKQALVIKPTTFMNLSGDALQKVMRYYKIPPEDVLVVRDDIDLEIGKVRVKAESGSGGHNGVKSIIDRVGDKFTQLKIGVGRPQGQEEAENYVLQNPADEERAVLESAVSKARDELSNWLEAQP